MDRNGRCECSLVPKLLRSDGRTVGQRLELGPRDARIDGRLCAYEDAETAVCACDDVLADGDLGVVDNSLRDQLGVLDEIRRGVDDARNDDQAIGETQLVEDGPLVWSDRFSGLWSLPNENREILNP